MPITFIPQEQLVYQTRRKILTITSHRVLYHSKAAGVTDITSIMLEDLCSCSVGKNDPRLMLVFAGIFVILSVLFASTSQNSGVAIGGIVFGLILTMLYFAFRRATLALASAGAVIRVDLTSLTAQEITEVVTQITTAKDARFQLQRFTYAQS